MAKFPWVIVKRDRLTALKDAVAAEKRETERIRGIKAAGEELAGEQMAALRVQLAEARNLYQHERVRAVELSRNLTHAEAELERVRRAAQLDGVAR